MEKNNQDVTIDVEPSAANHDTNGMSKHPLTNSVDNGAHSFSAADHDKTSVSDSSLAEHDKTPSSERGDSSLVNGGKIGDSEADTSPAKHDKAPSSSKVSRDSVSRDTHLVSNTTNHDTELVNCDRESVSGETDPVSHSDGHSPKTDSDPSDAAGGVRNSGKFSEEGDPDVKDAAHHVVDVDMAESDVGAGGDQNQDKEVTQLIPNGKQGSREMVDNILESEDDEVEVMADTVNNMDGRLENLTQSILDLQGKAELGAEFAPPTYVRRRGIRKYGHSLKTFLPVRPNLPKDILPITSSGCLNTCMYGWVTTIIIQVFRKGVDSLKSYRLSDRDSAETTAARLKRLWEEEVERRGRDQASFRRVVFRAYRTRFICNFIFLLLFVLFSLFNPAFLIRKFLEYLSNEQVEVGVGLTYVVGMVLCEFVRSLCMGQAWLISYQAGMRIRSGAVTLLFEKILNLKGFKEKTVGELVNLVSNDSQRIFEAIAVGPLVLAGPVAMTVACIYAVWYLGPWALVGCVTFVGFYPFNAFISRLTTYLRRRGIFVTDKRVRMMNELLSCIKLIKMYAWERPFTKKISDIRLEERGILEKSAIVQSISTGTAIMVPTLASALTFIAIVSAGNNLTAAEAFSFVALLNAMRFVLGVLPYGIKSLSEVTVSLKRYTSILLMEEMEAGPGSPPAENRAIELKDATLAWSSVENMPTDMPEKKKKSKGKEADGKRKGSGNGKEEERRKMLKDDATNNLMSEGSSESATLTNITFSLEKGKLVGVCGSVGCGKSSLIQAILGRMERKSGSVCVGGSIAYVPQQAWVMNATARENILFGSPYNEERYNKVVEASALQSDFESMVSGDLTEIGERGINLSGGQKQRISIARALYSDSDIYLLDDPLSAVDIHVGRHIFTRCIMEFLAGKSVIFVTHQLQYLPQCNEILFLKDGQVSERGHHDDLMGQNREYATLMRIYYKEHTSEVAEEEGPEVTSELSSSPRPAGLERALSTSSGGTVSVGAKSRVIIERALSVTSKASRVEEMGAQGDQATTDSKENTEKEKGKLIAAEETNKGSVDREVFVNYMKSGGGFCVSFLVFTIFLLSITCQNSASLFLSYWLGQGSGNTTVEVNNETIISESVKDHPQLNTFILIYGMIVIAMVVFLGIRAVVFMKFTLRASSTMHDDVFAKILRCPMSFFDTTPLGRIVNRFSSDMDEVDVRLPMTFEVFINNILHVLFSLGMISYVAPWFLLVLAPLVITFFIMYRIFTSTVRDIKRLDMVSRAPLVSHITASIQGITTIYAYSKTQEFLNKFCNMLNMNTIPFVMFFISNRWLALRLDLLCIAVTGFTSLIVILTHEHITPAMAGLALSSAIQMTGLFQFTVRLATETEARFTSVQRVFDYSKTIEPEAASIVPDKRPGQSWPKKGGMVFRSVQIRYRENLPLVLKGVSFKVNAQEKIGIVGRTGSGKSTLGVALFRLVELAGGSIKIDDLDISEMGLEDLRSKLSIIPQDPVLFVGTVRYNLDPLNQHADNELWTALEKCHIKESIAGLEQKLESPVVENGENFSVGERQLLCMARALLRHSKILMLDEATAAIDTETDALVQATLKEAFWDCTMLIIAHRLNTVLTCDKILVMDDGKVAEFDRPTALMSKPNSVFRNMLQATEGSGLQ